MTAPHSVAMTTDEAVLAEILFRQRGYTEVADRIAKMLKESEKRAAWRNAPYCDGNAEPPVWNPERDSGCCAKCGWRGRVWQGRIGKHKPKGS